ncbi:PMR5 N-terminal domain, partial [Sesbania bispinosa]
MAEKEQCDYSNGEWVQDNKGPLYNDTTCGMIKEGRNCFTHGRPDSGYLYWRWKPNQCHLPSSTPNLVYQNGKDNQFSRWHFPSYNASISLYWSPFLVQGVEKSNTRPNNKLYLDHVDEGWTRDIDQMDLIVLSFGHWFLLPAVYHEGKALRTTLNSIIERRGAKGREIDVIVTTFTPHHFEGEWDKAGACPKTKPYKNGEKQLEGMDAEMRKVEVEEVEDAKAKANKFGRFRLEALDVTKLALLRPDGHP